ncbi:MAG: MGMT family protein [Candidatus Bathyarchaeota archaeon]|nr:MGMT family protein [Candidatus Bathyarchaeota archaeon]
MIEIYVQTFTDTWFAVALNQQQILTTTFNTTEEAALNSILEHLPFNYPFQVFHNPSNLAKDVLATLKEVYDGKDPHATYNLAMDKLPPYTKKVLQATAAIPPGYITAYGALAHAVGGGSRAVGNVMAANPFAPLIPCHRVVKSDFSLGGYGMGLKLKAELLYREKRGYTEPKKVPVNGNSLTVYPAECTLKTIQGLQLWG